MRRSTRLPFLVLSAILSCAAEASAQGDPPDEEAGKALFIQHCATCHGETGDGKGVTQLDRPARSFRDGGFSFGNTPEALYRTISTGIPGTPMPGFDTAIDEAGRRAVARYVRSLGPPEEETDVSAAVLEVRDVPLVVRGHLPPIREGADAHPRGLLLGTTSGLTFEYRVDDVRLLGIRQGPFVRRADWTGRGGTPLEPLGPVIHTLHGGKPGELFRLVQDSRDEALAAKLRSTWVRGGDVGLTYRLRSTDGRAWADVDETVRAVATARASGFQRRLVVRSTAVPGGDGAEPGGDWSWSLSADLIAPIGPAIEDAIVSAGDGHAVRAYRDDTGLTQVVCIDGASHVAADRLHLASGTRWEVEVTTFLCTEWNDEVRAAVAAEVAR